ncbi:hypothetical protein [Vibrio sp. CAU 1672]|uniref:hypothetical protein n=1 Tax=Vibrio sp. CAU 1672 TaxID=3032594 RepID=UPI0023DCAFF3|nr:hypothetical protein [Vibrio sp. CAU 1672]MDF2152699.1 hypothetical protein [Vibrio sp. CAU 1672]
MALSKLVLLSVLIGVSFFSLAKSGPEIKFGQAYTWEHKIALQKGGFRDTAKAIPCPCIWNNPRKRGS